MERNERKLGTAEDGRPAETRQGEEPQSEDEAAEDLPDDETVDSVGY